jgi:zinc transporter 1/2/3
VEIKLVQGIMSSVSAGMLIYASCIEMLAADFVSDPQLKLSSYGMQALALTSLLAGMGGMSVIG